MAQKIQMLLIDDLDGSEANETISFAVDGVSYEIDLNEDNAAQLRDAFARWTGHARKAGRRGAGRRTGAASRSGDTGAIREWARANGYQVSDRGRVSAQIREAYAVAH
ncbi:MAG: Lsr2 family protein [Beutenbergiaceae bacterium]